MREDDSRRQQPSAQARRGRCDSTECIADGKHDGDRADGGPVGDAQDVGTCQGIAKERLRGDAGQGQGRAHRDDQDHPWQAEVEDDPSCGVGLPMAGDRMKDDREDPTRRNFDAAEAHGRPRRQDHPCGKQQPQSCRLMLIHAGQAICRTAKRSSRAERSNASRSLKCEQATCRRCRRATATAASIWASVGRGYGWPGTGM